MGTVAAALIASGVTGCGDSEQVRNQKDAVAVMKAKSMVSELLQRPPFVRTIQAGPGELIEVEFYVKGLGTMMEKRLCYIWRDKQFQNSSLSCPSSAELLAVE